MVLYNHQPDSLKKGIGYLLSQFDMLVLADNTPGRDDSNAFADDRIIYIPLGANKGIARAQNIGVKTLIDNDVDYVFFSDQDSLLPPDIKEKMIAAHTALKDAGIPTGSLGSIFVNSKTGKPYADKNGIKDRFMVDGIEVREVFSVGSSGSMIHRDAFLVNGGFDEALFIDGVDNEWGWRAAARHNMRNFEVPGCEISQTLGEGDNSIMGKQVSISSPARVFYQFRNYIWLFGKDYVPAFWKWRNFWKYAVKLFYFPIMCSPRGKYMTNILKGIRDGFGMRRRYLDKEQFPLFDD